MFYFKNAKIRKKVESNRTMAKKEQGTHLDVLPKELLGYPGRTRECLGMISAQSTCGWR
jgi:hypothetical protein